MEESDQNEGGICHKKYGVSAIHKVPTVPVGV